MEFEFTVTLRGSGETQEDAWQEAVEAFQDDPGDYDKADPIGASTASEFHRPYDDEDDELEEDYPLSENQLQFCRDAQSQGLSINCRYSGRGMYGKRCPSVVIDHAGEFGTKANVSTDSMGLGIVVYARG
jgi:hypothetical protein